jgi:2,3-bisphosphoglycerate-dependent phosphoglycerate mutase
MKRTALLLLVILLAACMTTSTSTTTTAAVKAPPATTVILVRHAEKAAPDGDPPLSEAGNARAQELARVLAGAHISAIYTTQYIRTRETARPLATALGVTPVAISTGTGYAAAVAADIAANHAGQTVLVVGHTTTTVELLTALGVAGMAAIPETEYDNLFVCTVVEGRAPVLTALRYGAAAR